MHPDTALVAALQRDRQHQAAAHRLTASTPRCRSRRTAALIHALDRALHLRPRQPRHIIICGA